MRGRVLYFVGGAEQMKPRRGPAVHGHSRPAAALHVLSMLIWSLLPAWATLFDFDEHPWLSGGMMLLSSGAVQVAVPITWQPQIVSVWGERLAVRRADPEMGDKLAAAYGRPYNADLLEAVIQTRVVSKLVCLGRQDDNGADHPELASNLVQRLDAVKNGGRFAKLHGHAHNSCAPGQPSSPVIQCSC